MSVGTTIEPRTRATSRRAWPVAIAFAGSLFAGAVVFEVSGIHVKDNGSDQVDYCAPKSTPFYDVKCEDKKDPTKPKDWGSLAFFGRFIEYTTVNPNWFIGPTVPKTTLVN